MAEVTAAAAVRQVRDATGCSASDIRLALVEADGDAEKAIEILRVKEMVSSTHTRCCLTPKGGIRV